MTGNIPISPDTENFIKKYVHFPSKKDMKLTSIIILTHNQLSCTKLCIESIRKFTHKDIYEIIVVDNNSTDDTVQWLKRQKDLKVIYNNENKGFPAGCNQGIEVAKGDSILLLNNDTIVTPGWLNNLQTALYSSDEIGIVGPISNSVSNFQQVETNYFNILEMINFAFNVNVSNPTSWDEKIKLIGFCYLIKREVINKVGVLDERFTPGNFEDDDFSFRALERGYKLLLCRDVFIHHFGSVSFKSKGNEFSNVFYNNQAKFSKKWNIDTNHTGAIRLDVINMIDEPTPRPLNVLEVGCGLGTTLLEIKNRYKGSKIYGIEKDPHVGKLTKHVCEAIIGDIEELELPYEEEYFDYIICADILDRLVDPWSTLDMLKKYLKKGGHIIASIPNIMYIETLFDIIKGNFTYVDSGVLDKTRLRFFTLNEINKLFSGANFTIQSINAIAAQPTTDSSNLISALCSISSPDARDQYLVYQYIVKASLNNPAPRFDQGHLLDLKFKLMRLDNDIDIDNSLNGIIDFYINNKENFIGDFRALLDECIIEKDKVVKLVANEALNRNLNDLYESLQ